MILGCLVKKNIEKEEMAPYFQDILTLYVNYFKIEIKRSERFKIQLLHEKTSTLCPL